MENRSSWCSESDFWWRKKAMARNREKKRERERIRLMYTAQMYICINFLSLFLSFYLTAVIISIWNCIIGCVVLNSDSPSNTGHATMLYHQLILTFGDALAIWLSFRQPFHFQTFLSLISQINWSLRCFTEIYAFQCANIHWYY